ncbi:hypothetical protein HUJ04_007899 [Dendroctonus ponderosae]
MRVCFGTLCFSSRLNTASDEEAIHQVVISSGGGGTSLDSGAVRAGLVNELENETMAEGGSCGAPMGGTEELLRLVAERDEEIRRLQAELALRNREIFELRSQLDKFQSVMAITHSHPASPKGLGGQLRPRKQRAGISAEPQNEKSILEMSSTTFPTIYKDER